MLDMFSFKSISYTLQKIEHMQPKKKAKVFINQFENHRSGKSYFNQLRDVLRAEPLVDKYLSETAIPKSIFFKQISDGIIDRIPEQKKTEELLKIVETFAGEVARG